MLHLKQRHQLIQPQEPAQMQLFELRPLMQNSSMRAVQFDFSPVSGISQLPTINLDSEFLPFLFISPLEKARLGSNEQKGENFTCTKLAEAFRAKLSEAKEESQHLNRVILKPRPLSSYCQICKESFSNYKEHVKHQIHLKKVSQNQFSRHIEKLVDNFQKVQQKGWKRNRPACQKTDKSEDSLQPRVKKIIIDKSEFRAVSITKIDLDSKESQLF